LQEVDKPSAAAFHLYYDVYSLNGTILQVNISPGGLPKRAVAQALVTPLGLEGDSHAHPRIHGGAGQALLLVAQEAIDELRQFGFPLVPGQLGENLTTQGIDRRQMRPGHQFRAGTALIEITRLRFPCNTLDVYGPALKQAVIDAEAKAGNYHSPRWGLSGFYARVLKEGIVRPGDPIELLAALA
jgi:MOSC domain-containing protein YiiM